MQGLRFRCLGFRGHGLQYPCTDITLGGFRCKGLYRDITGSGNNGKDDGNYLILWVLEFVNFLR